LAEYPLRLAELDLDLALAPLEINRFNECKSNLRLLEYGVLGIPVIATDIEPYRCGLPVTLIHNRSKSWIQAIRERISQHEELQKEGAALREAVLRDWTLDKTLPAWVSAWKR
jgi:glycosyltransferase involved in cell wall biosynthesis